MGQRQTRGAGGGKRDSKSHREEKSGNPNLPGGDSKRGDGPGGGGVTKFSQIQRANEPDSGIDSPRVVEVLADVEEL